jgi:hypothetical protein
MVGKGGRDYFIYFNIFPLQFILLNSITLYLEKLTEIK